MSRLTQCLEDFNRKERYWLIRNALGEPDKPVPLARSFCDSLSKETGLDVPQDAWWAIDYHIDWLFGALQAYLGQETSGVYQTELLTGSQEDFDFVVAYDKTLILIEAKAMGHWKPAQYESKFGRLGKLEESLFNACGLTVKSLALSPRKPTKKIGSGWVELSMDRERTHFTVLTRSPDAKNPIHWRLDSVANPGHKPKE